MLVFRQAVLIYFILVFIFAAKDANIDEGKMICLNDK